MTANCKLQTVNCERARLRAAFTLVELTVVVAVLLILSAAVVPNLIAMENSQRERAFYNTLANMPAQAREKAIAQGRTVSLQYNDTANQFQLHTTDDNGNDQTATTLDLLPGIQVNRVVLGTNDSSPTDWKLNFYPDGSSDGGGAEMSLPDSTAVSLSVEAANGHSQLLGDRLPDPNSQRWQAGDYVHRTQ